MDYGWTDPACPRPPSIPSDYGDGVVTPHASFLALDFAPEAALENLANLGAPLPCAVTEWLSRDAPLAGGASGALSGHNAGERGRGSLRSRCSSLWASVRGRPAPRSALRWAACR